MTDDFTADTSPSQTAISESALNEKALCDYVVNVADGCRHGCQFCYVQSMPSTFMDPGDKFAEAGIDDPGGEWGDYTLYREDVVENTARDCERLLPDRWTVSERGQGVVGVSFTTDCYMDARAAELTRGVVETLVEHDRTVRILTRNPKLLVELHGEVYADLPSDSVAVGTSIPTLAEAEAHAIEPNAPPVQHRLQGLAALQDVAPDVPTYVSMSPTYPTHDAGDLEHLLATISERLDPTVVFHEPINPRAGNIEACVQQARESGCDGLAMALERITDVDEWRRYAVRQLRDVQRAAESVGQRVHLWPDKDLVENARTAEQREWCAAWRERPSPEEVGDGPACTAPYPDAPAVQTLDQQRLGADD